MRTRPIGLAAGVVLAFLASSGGGCSGGGDDGPGPGVCEGAPEPGAAGPGDVEGWFPLAPGWAWNYRVAGQPVTRPIDVRVEIAGTRAHRGFAAMVLREVDPVTGAELAGGSALLASTAAGLAELGDGTASDPTPSTYDLRFPVTVGGAWSQRCTGLDVGEDLDEDGKPERFDLSLEGRVLGLEEVTVPAGTFAGTARVRLSLSITIHPTRSDLEPVSTTAWQETWYARGVGIVRRSDGGELSPTTVFELVGWSGPAGGGGLAELTRLVVPPPSADPYVAPWRVVPARGGAARALVLEVAWRDGPIRLVGRFVEGGAAGAPFEVVPQWPADSNLPQHLATQVAPGPDLHLIAFGAVPAGAPSTAEIRAARVTAAGIALDGPSGLAVAQCARWSANAVAASRVGDGYLVAWGCDEGEPGVYAATVRADGAVGAPARLGAGPVQFLQAAGAGAEHLVVWGRGSSAETEVVGVRVSAAGGPLDATPVRLVADAARYKLPGDLACGPAGCVLAWREWDPPRLLAARVVEGRSLDPSGVPLAGGGADPLLAPAGDGWAVAWADGLAVRLARLDAALGASPEGGVAISPRAGNAQTCALLSASADDAWVAFDWIASYAELHAARWIW